MILGFTGTQKGMTDNQKLNFEAFVIVCLPSIFVHGDCIGADTEAHRIVRRILPKCRIIIYPSPSKAKRGFCKADEERHPPLRRPGMNPNLSRNQAIVDLSDKMAACPAEAKEILRSGTWSTIRYARRVEKPLTIIYP